MGKPKKRGRVRGFFSWMGVVLFIGFITLAIVTRGSEDDRDRQRQSSPQTQTSAQTRTSTQWVETEAEARRCLDANGASRQFMVALRRKLGVDAVYHVKTTIELPQLLMAYNTRPGGAIRLAAAVLLKNCTVRSIA